ncbi:MAG: hypothetical protein JW801_13405 [Bacteroidales bacterium]|nr:hypothetical protein [Bacteroidales bacterium]
MKIPFLAFLSLRLLGVCSGQNSALQNPFRYCEHSDLQVPIEDVKLTPRVYNYRFNHCTSYFSCSDTMLNQVWDLCKNTLKRTIFAEYRKLDAETSCRIEFPKGMKGEFIMTRKEDAIMIADGKAMEAYSGAVPPNEGVNQIVILNK